jgi:hypothetical protein
MQLNKKTGPILAAQPFFMRMELRGGLDVIVTSYLLVFFLM